MAQGTQAIKRRIRSVDTTKKITNAMELISTTKLRKMREKMETTRLYTENLSMCVNNIYQSCGEDVESIYFKKNKSEKTLTIVFTSDLGLCGAYNANTLRLVQDEINKKDPIIVVGTKGYIWANNRQYNVIDKKIGWDNLNYNDVSILAKEAVDMYVSGEVKEIRVLYTTFVNAVTFKPVLKTIMPINPNDFQSESNDANVHVDTIFEPNAQTVLNHVIPMYLKSSLYTMLLETKTSEQASRRLAMENATDNAEELREKLVLQFNQARQAAITQEISEIVGGADAL